MGFIEFIRGKYDTNVLKKRDDMIKIFMQEMSCQERRMLQEWSFDDIWSNLWMNHNSKLYINTFSEAKRKYHKLNTRKLLSQTECKWTDTEYGFPKGRKNINEGNLQCAIREFREESGFSFNDFEIQYNLGYVEENFIGTNGIHYKHVYYIAFVLNDNLPKLDISNIHQAGEIKNLGWYTFKQCLQMIRSYDVEKKKVLETVHNTLKKCSKFF